MVFSCKIIQFLVHFDNKGIVHLIQYILSICSHAHAPQLQRRRSFSSELFVEEEIQLEECMRDSEMIGIIHLLNNAVTTILGNNINCTKLCVQLDSFYE